MCDKKNIVHIAIAFDTLYKIPFYVLVTSIFRNNSNNKIELHVIAPDLSNQDEYLIRKYIKQNRSKIFFYKPDSELIGKLIVPAGTHFTSAIYYRLFFPILIPKAVSKIIYLDADTLVIGDLKDFYNIIISHVPVGAARDNQMHIRDDIGINDIDNYFNSGVLLINIKRWHEKKITEKAVNFITLNPNKIPFGDQDALNNVLINQWHKLDQKFNIMNFDIPTLEMSEFKGFLSDKIIIHYNNYLKPWKVVSDHRLNYLYHYYFLQFFKTNIGSELLSQSVDLEFTHIMIENFQGEDWNVETIIGSAFQLHLVYLKVVKDFFADGKVKDLLESHYNDNNSDGNVDEKSLMEQFILHKETLVNLYQDIAIKIPSDKLASSWLMKWENMCKRKLRNYNNQFTELINDQLLISGPVKSYLYYFIIRVYGIKG